MRYFKLMWHTYVQRKGVKWKLGSKTHVAVNGMENVCLYVCIHTDEQPEYII